VALSVAKPGMLCSILKLATEDEVIEEESTFEVETEDEVIEEESTFDSETDLDSVVD